MYKWKELYKEANKNNHQKNISPFINAGYVTCVIESSKDKIYNGSNIVTSSKLSMCAETSAVANMVSNQDYVIRKMVIVNELGELLMPCENCMEYLMDFCDDEDFEILVDAQKEKTIKFHDLLPDYWGTFRASKED